MIKAVTAKHDITMIKRIQLKCPSFFGCGVGTGPIINKKLIFLKKVWIPWVGSTVEGTVLEVVDSVLGVVVSVLGVVVSVLGVVVVVVVVVVIVELEGPD